MIELEVCLIEGCDELPDVREWCLTHYKRGQANGSIPVRSHAEANRPDEPPPHGTYARYRTTVPGWACREACCRAAAAEARRSSRDR